MSGLVSWSEDALDFTLFEDTKLSWELAGGLQGPTQGRSHPRADGGSLPGREETSSGPRGEETSFPQTAEKTGAVSSLPAPLLDQTWPVQLPETSRLRGTEGRSPIEPILGMQTVFAWSAWLWGFQLVPRPTGTSGEKAASISEG